MTPEAPAAHRIRIDTTDSDFVSLLVESNGAFETYYDALIFCASLAAYQKLAPVPVDRAAAKPSPIRLEIFETNGLDHVINLLAAHATKSVNVLAGTSEAMSKRIEIFEGLARAGLQSLRKSVETKANPLEAVELAIHNAIASPEGNEDEGLDDILNAPDLA